MADTYSQIYIHIVFAVQNRNRIIQEMHREQLQKYITGIIQKRGSKLISIYCMPDHTHIFIGCNPAVALSDLVRDIKSVSTNFINESKWFKNKFYWQNGFGAFSYSKSHIGRVAKYIENQQEHHKRESFKEEYLKFLKRFEVNYKEQFLFEWFD